MRFFLAIPRIVGAIHMVCRPAGKKQVDIFYAVG